jgi:hypothetical protein
VYNYNSLYSIFCNKYSFTIEDFDLLTPVQAYQILFDGAEIERNKLEFFQAEFRNICFFILKSSMASTDNIRRPTDLYKLHSEVTTSNNKPFKLDKDDYKIIEQMRSLLK